MSHILVYEAPKRCRVWCPVIRSLEGSNPQKVRSECDVYETQYHVISVNILDLYVICLVLLLLSHIHRHL